jgi:penicillin-binding protein 1A
VNTVAPSGSRRRLEWILIGLSILVLTLGVMWERCGIRGCPNVERLTSYQPGGATVLLDADGVQFADLAPVRHEVIPLDSLPEHVPAAFLAVEDKRFFEHRGVDYRRVIGAAASNVRARGFAEGFSTITMQLARNVWPEQLPGRNRTLRRKVLEIRVARDIEERFTKPEILELYLNHIYFGGGSYGIEAASRNFFDKSAAQLALHEAALLAALPKSPTLYNPRRFAARAHERRNLVLRLMAEQERIEPARGETARSARLAVRSDPPARRTSSYIAPWFVEATRRVLEDRFGEGVYTAPLRVHTTLSRRAQQTAEQQLDRQLRAIETGAYGAYEGQRYASGGVSGAVDYLQGAFVLMEAATGDVQALVGGRDFTHSRFDRATQARRQPGSAFKPFVFAAAVARGYPPSQLVSDSVLRLELPGGEVWEPRNIDGEFAGTVTLREALVESRNVATVRLAAEVGLNDITRLATRAGIRSELPSVPSIALGTAGVTALELTSAYTTFARLGTAVAPRFVTKVENSDGRLLWQPVVTPREVMDSAAAYLITDMLEEAVERGTGRAVRAARFRGPAAGKTGTTNDGADAWFVGFTTSHVATVWIGFDRPRPIVEDASGGRLAAPVWGRVMREHAAAGVWPTPSGVIALSVDPETGLVLEPGCSTDSGRSRTELFVRGNEPASACPSGQPVVERRSLSGRIGAWFGRQWRHLGHWLTRHFGSEQPARTPQDGDYLGVPRLPLARDLPVPTVRPDSFRPPLGVPVDSLQDTTRMDTLRLDTLRPALRRDTVPRDTLRPDTLRTDALPADTLRPDTLRTGTQPSDTLRADTSRARAAGQESVRVGRSGFDHFT